MNFGSSNMNNPFFSIIIPTYNSAKTLSNCLDSIIKQSFQNFEIVIIDCISNDDTLNIIRQYASTNPKISFISEKDNGVYDAMNKGINRAKGKWIYFLGSDDQLFSNEILSLVGSRIINTRNCKIIYGNVQIVGDTSWANDNQVYDGRFNTRKILLKNICHQAIFYNYEFVSTKVGKYNLEYKLCADWDFNLRCWSLIRFHYFNIIIAKFYSGGLSTLNIADDKFVNDLFAIKKAYFKSHFVFEKLLCRLKQTRNLIFNSIQIIYQKFN